MAASNPNVVVIWRRRFYLWSDEWPVNGPEVSGRRRSRYSMLRAGMALADEAITDGSLKGKRDWWPLRHLATRMDLSPNTAAAVLRWLETSGWLGRRAGMVTKEGRTPDVRWLTLPIAQESSSALRDGPLVNNGESIAQQVPSHDSTNGDPSRNDRIQPLRQSVVPSSRSSVGNHLKIAAELKARLYGDVDERIPEPA